MIPIKNNEGFFDYPVDSESYKKLYEKRLVTARVGTVKKDGDSIVHKIYNKKYNVYEITTTKKRKVFDVKFKTSCEKLIIDYLYLTKIKSLPAECVCLDIRNINNKVDLSYLSENLISLSMYGWEYRFNDFDLSKLKNLKILNISTRSNVINLPRLPESIVYLNCYYTTNIDLSKIDLRNYPNLKYISVFWNVPLSKSILKAHKLGKIVVNKVSF